ncbi:MAG: serpin family protein [Acetatifactor sp.]|nr:serpin family protein [Acetatifactor sp.]
MRKHWRSITGIILAGSMLAGCGSQPGSAEPLTGNGRIVESGTTQEQEPAGAAGEGMEPVLLLAEEGQGWNREDDSSCEALQAFSQQLMLENMDEENPLLSPVSAYLALGMVGMGAKGETLQEFQNILGSNMPAISQKMMEQYPQDQEGMILTIANSVWVDQQLTPNGKWIAEMEEIFKGEGYRGALSSQEVMEQINSWCNENTRGLIPRMLEEPLGKEACLALLDAVYFKGDWLVPFEETNTLQRPFTREDGTEKQVDTMSMWEKEQSYLHSSLGEGVLLPYQGGDFAYVAVLPNEGTEVRELYRQLTPEALEELLASENRELCNLRLPKYEVSFDQVLNDSLQAMGLVRAFDGELADFSSLTEQGEPLCISLVQQKAVFKMDERGTEAAAVTMVVMNKCTAIVEPQPRKLYFDRPFVYMILDLETQVPLFVGIMDDPS